MFKRKKTPDYTQILENIQLPGTQRTLGGEKAVKKLHEEADGLYIELSFGFPTAHLWDGLSERVQCRRQYPAAAYRNRHRNCHAQSAARVATIKGVKNIIAVASGKGGVGKSTTTANLAMAMARMGARVCVLDADLYGPSQPTMPGVQDRKPEQENKKLIPVEADGDIQVMSIGFLVDTDTLQSGMGAVGNG